MVGISLSSSNQLYPIFSFTPLYAYCFLVDSDSWRFTSSGAYCEYDNLDYDFSLCPNECYWLRISAEEYVAIYGRLYNGYAISDDRGVCPEDWHVPNEDDWNLLIDKLLDITLMKNSSPGPIK